MLLPVEAQPLLAVLLPHFSQPTATRFVVLTAAAILPTGRRTVANLLRPVGRLAPGHDASYRRVLSAARWSGLALGCALARPCLRPCPGLTPREPARFACSRACDHCRVAFNPLYNLF